MSLGKSSKRSNKKKPTTPEDIPAKDPASLVPTTGDCPTERYGHSCTLVGHFMYIFGGCDPKGNCSSELYVLNLLTRQWEALTPTGTPPKGRIFHTSILWADRIYIFGGKSNGYMNDLFQYDIVTKTWSEIQLKGSPPSRRYGHCAFVHGSNMYVYGGYDTYGYKCNDLFQFNFETQEWTKRMTANAGLEVFHHLGVYHSGSLYILGGYENNCIMHEFRFSTNLWATVSTTGPTPAPRWGHKGVIYKNRLYMFGGCDSVISNRDLLCFHFDECRWEVLNWEDGAQGRYFHSACVYDGKMYTFGGKNIHNFSFNDVHAYSLDKYHDRHKDTLATDFLKMLRSADLADMSFKFPNEDNKIIRAHRCILAARCPNFAAMFRSGMREAIDGEVVISDAKAEIFALLIEYIYSSNVDLATPQQALELMALSDQYSMDNLKSLCEREILKHIHDFDDALTVFEDADKYNAAELFDGCMKLAFKDCNDMVTKGGSMRNWRGWSKLNPAVTQALQKRLQDSSKKLPSPVNTLL